MKKPFISVFIFSCISLFLACGSREGEKKDSVDSAQAVNKAKETVVPNVSEFVTNAASGGMMEVQLGKYASQNAASSKVKNFGTMMVQDHTQANEELEQLATARNIALPAAVSESHQKHMDELMQQKGKEFDKAYVKMMVEDHEEDVREFQKAGIGLPDTAIRGFAQRALPVLQKHLDSIKAIQNTMK